MGVGVTREIEPLPKLGFFPGSTIGNFVPRSATDLLRQFRALLGAGSQLVSARLAARFGLIPTMVFTHLPANLFLILAALMPNAPLAIACLLLRMALAQMDVPARQAYVMSVVPPEERAAAASVTNVPRSLAAAITPLVAGLLLERTSFGWPLILGGALKAAYDLLLLAQFGRTSPKP